MRLRIEALHSLRSPARKRKVGEAFFAIYPRPPQPRTKPPAGRDEDWYRCSTVAALLRVGSEQPAMHCGRLAFVAALHEHRPPATRSPLLSPHGQERGQQEGDAAPAPTSPAVPSPEVPLRTPESAYHSLPTEVGELGAIWGPGGIPCGWGLVAAPQKPIPQSCSQAVPRPTGAGSSGDIAQPSPQHPISHGAEHLLPSTKPTAGLSPPAQPHNPPQTLLTCLGSPPGSPPSSPHGSSTLPLPCPPLFKVCEHLVPIRCSWGLQESL